MSGDFEDIRETDDSTVEGNGMIWFVGEHLLYRERGGKDEGLGGFATFLYSLENNANEMDTYVSAGLVYQGLIPGRPRDKTGLAFSRGWFSDELKNSRRADGKPIKHHESVIEFNHRFELGRGIAVQPDIQYLIDPAGTKEISNAFLAGFKIAVQF